MPLFRTCVMCKVPRTSSTGSGEWLLYLDNIYQNTPSPLTREVGSLMIFSEVDARWNCNPFRSCAVAAQSITKRKRKNDYRLTFFLSWCIISDNKRITACGRALRLMKIR